jgi:thioesterase domain-containing protein
MRVRIALTRCRPLPEPARESYFLQLHSEAERAYEPQPYPGEILTFYGERLYQDPALGWGDLALGGVRSYPVPGEHTNNRQLMGEPNVEVVRDELLEYLDHSP